jgi:NADH-quinone oxidoreductase subunit L
MTTVPLEAWLLIFATLAPLVSFAVLVFAGKRMGTPFAGLVGTTAIALSFVASLWALITWIGRGRGYEWGAGNAPINIPLKWLPVGGGIDQTNPGYLDIGIYIDSLTIAMFAMITLVAMLVHVFSIGYMREDKRFPRFFTYLGLFCFSMLGLVIGGTTLQLFVFWELVGLCSYLLIGFWYEKKSASNAAIKAFVTNRVGDFGFLIGFGILFYHLGNVSLPNMWLALSGAQTGGEVALANGVMFSPMLLTIMGIGLFFGAVGKSAQFPLHVWLPDAMEGPTPVSALIHAATMVAAGVYLVGRIFPVLTPDAKLFIAIIGAVTLTMAALIAIAQSDIKKVLAYSTLSQLGYMILAMGIGSWVGGLFHLITHAFFKALLFLGSGSVIHAAHHEQELPQYGGLWRKIPWTALTFLIAVFAIAGTPTFSGYYSKDLIIAGAGGFAILSEEGGRSPYYWLFFILPTGIAYVTAFYMMRCWMLTFWGKPRNQHVYDHAHEAPVMYVPLIALAVLAWIGGSNFMGVRDLLKNAVIESNAMVATLRADRPFYANHPTDVFATAWPADLPEHAAHGATEEGHPEIPPPPVDAPVVAADAYEQGTHLMHAWVWWAFIVGIGLGFLMYMNGYAVANVLMKFPPLRWLHIWLYRRMYFDELYYWVFVKVTLALSWLSAIFDKYVIDGIVNLAGWSVKRSADAIGLHDKYVIDGAVNGLGKLSHDLGAAVRAPQTGRIRMYVTVLMIAVTLGLAGAIFVVLSR